MRPSQGPAPPTGDQRRAIPGPRFVIVLFLAGSAVAGVILLVAFLAVGDDAGGGVDEACREEPRLCGAVEEYAAALNARDAERLRSVVTDEGLRIHLRVDSEDELREALAGLGPADRIRDLRIARVDLLGDRAMVVARYMWGDQEAEPVYRLVRTDGDWFIDG